MKKIFSSVAVVLGLAAAAHAGSDKIVHETAAPGAYGTGFYIGIDGGINAYQEQVKDFGITTHSRVGGVGGLKAGYVFGTGVVRPTVEADL